MKATQAEFARMMNVSRKAVTVWKQRGSIVMDGDAVDVERSRALLLRNAAFESKGFQGAQMLDACETGGVKRERYNPPRDYGSPANLPEIVTTISVAIEGGASDMARLLLPQMPLDEVKELTDAWVRLQREAWIGSHAAGAAADNDLPKPPVGYAHWCDHPLFNEAAISPAEWEDILAGAEVAQP